MRVSNAALDFSGSGVYRTCHCIYVQQKQVAGEVSLTPGAVISELSGWFP